MEPQKRFEKVSSCCGFPLGVGGDTEGTNYYFCTKPDCYKACDAVSDEKLEQKSPAHTRDFKFMNQEKEKAISSAIKASNETQKEIVELANSKRLLENWEYELQKAYEESDIVGIALLVDALLIAQKFVLNCKQKALLDLWISAQISMEEYRKKIINL